MTSNEQSTTTTRVTRKLNQALGSVMFHPILQAVVAFFFLFGAALALMTNPITVFTVFMSALCAVIGWRFAAVARRRLVERYSSSRRSDKESFGLSQR